MTQNINTREWRKAPAYIELLGYFSKPQPIKRVRDFKSFGWSFNRALTPRQINRALDDYVSKGDLIRCSVLETLAAALSGAELRRLARKKGLSTSGSKSEIVERLLVEEHHSFEEMASQLDVFKCSYAALKIVESYQSEKRHQTEAVKVDCFKKLVVGDVRAAYKIVSKHYQYYPTYGENFRELTQNDLAEMDAIIWAKPPSLKEVSDDDLQYLRASACISIMWFDESPEAWLPSNFVLQSDEVLIAVNHLKSCSRLRTQIRRYPSEREVELRIKFQDYDIHSCELCRKMEGQVTLSSKVPDFPLVGCHSSYGCELFFERVFEDGVISNLDIEYDENEPIIHGPEENIVEKLQFLKSLFARDLISEQEYEAKKAEIIRRI